LIFNAGNCCKTLITLTDFNRSTSPNENGTA
jgi:hypothetical protein